MGSTRLALVICTASSAASSSSFAFAFLVVPHQSSVLMKHCFPSSTAAKILSSWDHSLARELNSCAPEFWLTFFHFEKGKNLIPSTVSRVSSPTPFAKSKIEKKTVELTLDPCKTCHSRCNVCLITMLRQKCSLFSVDRFAFWKLNCLGSTNHHHFHK